MRFTAAAVSFLLALILLIALITILNGSPAQAATTCAARPGVSHGAVWWRYRMRDGVRCWYPGSRHAARRVHSRPVALRRRSAPIRVASPAPPVEVPTTLKAVRVIPLSGGRFSPSERIERAFDVLIIFPTVEEAD